MFWGIFFYIVRPAVISLQIPDKSKILLLSRLCFLICYHYLKSLFSVMFILCGILFCLKLAVVFSFVKNFRLSWKWSEFIIQFMCIYWCSLRNERVCIKTLSMDVCYICINAHTRTHARVNSSLVLLVSFEISGFKGCT